MKRSHEREEGLNQLNKILENRSRVLIVHYSCESFLNPRGRTPRITSISILKLGSEQAKSFSIHLSAQLLKLDFLSLSEVEYDQAEKHMLDTYFSYLRSHRNYKWVHWKMLNSKYGFEAVCLRYEILGGTPISIPDKNKYDLSDVLRQIYSSKFENNLPNGKLLNLAKRNRYALGESLTGKQEAEAFDEQKFQELYFSTLSKVRIIANFLNAAANRKLKVAAHPIRVHGISLQLVKSHPILSTLYAAGTWLVLKMAEKAFDLLWSALAEQPLATVLTRYFN
ncbi:hypothetical protein [Pontibacter litorisediminis]|uniref:hypothetical protein n=1 Tax=Pontibacter litorisediminis TaxID=1846260 RepID=UPI0023EC49B4|nr:hypothetical protein [Pontibacter litorisediminis]